MPAAKRATGVNPSGRFFDTCILIYALVQADDRQAVAHRLLSEGGVISVQVLNEFTAVARRKFKLSYDEIAQLSSATVELCPEPSPLTLASHHAALGIAQRYAIHFYDALVVAAALEAGCTQLYTEDLQHGQKIESLTLINPFTSSS